MRFIVNIALLLALSLPAFAQPTSGNVRELSTLADLIALPQPIGIGRSFLIRGRSSIGDGGGGVFIYDSASTTATNRGTVFKPTNGDGRFVRQYSGDLDVKWFGAVGDNTADDLVPIQNAIDISTSGAQIKFPPGTYRISNVITGASDITLIGDGPNTSTIRTVSDSAPVIRFTDFSRFAVKNIALQGNRTNILHIIATGADVYYPLVERVFFTGVNTNSSAIFFDIPDNNPIYFPIVKDCVVNGGTAAPNVLSGSIGINFGGAGSTLTVGPRIYNTRIFNVHTGVRCDTVDTGVGIGLILDGIQIGARTGRGIHFISGSGHCWFLDTRFENGAIDVYVEFDAGTSDNFVSGTFSNASGTQIVDNGIRNGWWGTDGSGGVNNRLPNPLTLVSAPTLSSLSPNSLVTLNASRVTASVTGTSGQTVRHDGTTWAASSVISNDGTDATINGRLGVGTSPSQLLHISSGSPYLSIARTGGGARTFNIGVDASGRLSIDDATGGAVRYIMDTSGNFFPSSDSTLNLGGTANKFLNFHTVVVFFNNDPSIRSGSGSPEGVVAANVGSLYLRTDGGASTSLYVKEANDGVNTGWVAK